MANEHGRCPSCNADLDGGSIWQTGYDLARDGKHFYQAGMDAGHEEAEKLADAYAAAYGATREKGRWGRQIGICSLEHDRTVAWRCPDCNHEWGRP